MPEAGNLGNIDQEGMAALREALERRGMGDQMAALDTQSGTSPTASPLPPEASGSAPMPAGPASMGPEAPVGAEGNPEAKLILGAMRERLKAISVMEGGVPPKMPSGGAA